MPIDDIRKQELMRLFKEQPHSIGDIAVAAGVHYVTAHKWCSELRDAGLIAQLPFPRGKEKLWVASVSPSQEDGVVRVQARGQLYPIVEFTKVSQSQQDPWQVAQSFMALLYYKSWVSEPGNESRFQGGGFTQLEIKERIRRCRKVLIEELQVLEQILLVDEVFEPGAAAHKIMGARAMETIEQDYALAYETYERERTSKGSAQ